MMSFMVSEAARGVDLAARYPAFYRRLQEEPDLWERFEDSLDLLRRSQTNTLEPLPGPPSHDLSFLQTRPRPECTFITAERGGWGMTFTLNAAQLNSRFFSRQAEPVTRHGLGIGLDEDNWFTLFRETIVGEDGSWWVVLEGTPVAGVEAGLHLVVMVLPITESEKAEVCWQVSLTWGNYTATVVKDKAGRANFPWLSLEAVQGKDGPGIREDLVLTLTDPRT